MIRRMVLLASLSLGLLVLATAAPGEPACGALPVDEGSPAADAAGEPPAEAAENGADPEAPGDPAAADGEPDPGGEPGDELPPDDGEGEPPVTCPVGGGEPLPDLWPVEECPGWAPLAEATCELDVYRAELTFAAGDEPMLQMVGIYEGPSDHHFGYHPRGSIVVHVPRTARPLILALGSYEPVDWILDRGEGARIERILLYGYHEQRVLCADDVLVTDRIAEGFRACGYCWPFCEGGSDTQGLVADAEAVTGLELAAFFGCYHLDELTLDHACGVCVPDCEGKQCGDDGCGGVCGICPGGQVCEEDRCRSPETPPPADCAAVQEESHYCLALVGEGLAWLGLDSGVICPLGGPVLPLVSQGAATNSLVWEADHVTTCGGMMGIPGLLRVSLADGSWEAADVPCEAVAGWNGGYLVLSLYDAPMGLTWYATFEDAKAGQGTLYPMEFQASRLAVQGDEVWLAWHSTDVIEVNALPSGERVRDVALEGYDTWVNGMSVTSDGLLVLNAAFPEERIALFDAVTGEHLRDVPASRVPNISALDCRAN